MDFQQRFRDIGKCIKQQMLDFAMDFPLSFLSFKRGDYFKSSGNLFEISLLYLKSFVILVYCFLWHFVCVARGQLLSCAVQATDSDVLVVFILSKYFLQRVEFMSIY